MRIPPRISSRPHNPYDELASLADPEPAPDPDSPWDPEETLRVVPIPLDTSEPWSPPNHRRAKRKRKRKRPLRRSRRTLKLLIGAAALGALLVLGDRCAAMYAEKKAQQALQQQLGLEAAPQVDIHGFPFLTQVLAKDLQRVDITVPHVAADRVSLAKVKVSARDVRLTGDLPADVRGAVIGDLQGDVLLSFADMGRELGSSQVQFTDLGNNAVGAHGKLAVAGQELHLRAEAHLQRNGDRGISTDVDGISLDIPHVATYRPGKRENLTLHRETAERISRDAARAKALLSVPAVAERLGISDEDVAAALRSEDRLHELTGAPRFVEQLTHVNLVDVVVDHPWLLQKAGIDPKVLAALTHLRPPDLVDRLSLSFQLPKEAKDLHLREVTVERNGIRATLTGAGLPVGRT
ncbi:hypothetical protein FHS39_001010 [Streptomyces olivoverticillatus]|uniref:DUF2993 domain-containing protein n=1 Tax=Streptomyces olivoverticillatus TaxID=66427 RepID=A0A7W7PKQ5_9ACTN|nr:DUF2993 domain-containing protein [Streptomyces olivoverticillatus]MBB4892010.1 hypothetical protein [Streptomyces olivoverticillatus]